MTKQPSTLSGSAGLQGVSEGQLPKAPSASGSRRFHELDAIRGLAALSVVFHHFVMAFPFLATLMMEPGHILASSPLHAIWSGSQAVVLFFVLSGFVLELPFEKKQIPYGQFALKRLVRIYFPYLAAIALALVLKACLYTGSVVGMSSWFNRPWSSPTDVRMITNHVILIGSFANNALIPVVWSLVFEMRISFIFPALLRPLREKSLQFGLWLAGGVYISGFALEQVAKKFVGVHQDYTATVSICALFLLGSVLAKHREALLAKATEVRGRKLLGFWILGLLCYTAPHWGYKLPRAFWAFFETPVVALGCALFIVLALRGGKASSLLHAKPCIWLGACSYSLYLIHTVVLLSLVRLLAPSIGIVASGLIALAATLPCAWIFYMLFERPSVRLSQQIRL